MYRLPQNDLSALQKAVQKMPDNLDGWIDLCEAAERLGDYAEVLRASAVIIKLAPQQPQAHFIRGVALQNLDHIEEAIEAHQRVVALNANYLDAWINIGHGMQALNRLDEAEAACRRVISISGQYIAEDGQKTTDRSEYGSHYWNLAIVELLKGDLKNGFTHYPARFKAIANRSRPNHAQPLWRGEDLRGKTILITADQGFGDTLMMARYLPLLRQQAARVILQTQKALMPFLKGWDGIDDIVEQGSNMLPSFDTHAWEFDLPRHFGTTLETIPSKIPYLPSPQPDDATRLPDNGKPKIGVVWAGNPEHRNDKRRSIPLAEFKSLFTAAKAQFFSLNRDMRPGDDELLAQLPVTDLKLCLTDFAATAYFVNQLDLVITCDTSIAHLAGGMGKPVWILLPFAPSWHWMIDREDSPWYPTARLFRQKIRGDWGEVMGRMMKALALKF